MLIIIKTINAIKNAKIPSRNPKVGSMPILKIIIDNSPKMIENIHAHLLILLK